MPFIGYVQKTPYEERPGPSLQRMLDTIQQGKGQRFERTILEAAMAGKTPEEAGANVSAVLARNRAPKGILGGVLNSFNPAGSYRGAMTERAGGILNALLADRMQNAGISPEERTRGRRIEMGLEPPAPRPVPVNPERPRTQVVNGVLYREEQDGRWLPQTPEAAGALERPEDFTLSPGQARFQGGKKVAELPATETEPTAATFDQIRKYRASLEQQKPEIPAELYYNLFGQMPVIDPGYWSSERPATAEDFDKRYAKVPWTRLTEVQKQKYTRYLIQQAAPPAAAGAGAPQSLFRPAPMNAIAAVVKAWRDQMKTDPTPDQLESYLNQYDLTGKYLYDDANIPAQR